IRRTRNRSQRRLRHRQHHGHRLLSGRRHGPRLRPRPTGLYRRHRLRRRAPDRRTRHWQPRCQREVLGPCCPQHCRRRLCRKIG
ncbi:hypothetical protein HK405_000825, partial [Cladochytrium tenue]